MRHYEYIAEIDGPQSFKHCGRITICKGGGGGSSVTTQEIPQELKPLASAYTRKAIDVGNSGYDPYTGQRYADLNATQMTGLGQIADRAINGVLLRVHADRRIQLRGAAEHHRGPVGYLDGDAPELR